MGKTRAASVGKAHRTTGLIAQIDSDAEEVCGASGFAAFAAHAVFCAGGRGDLAGLAAVPGHHFKDVEGAGAHALGAADAGVVDLDGVGHGPGSAAWADQTAWAKGTQGLSVAGRRGRGPSPLFIRRQEQNQVDP
jgi:hypothetical protein